MFSDSAFPGALPLKREVALELLDRPDRCEAVVGTFLTFVMIPVEERFGEYRFAGASHSLAGAFHRAEEFAAAMFLVRDPQSSRGLVRGLLLDNAGKGRDGEYEYPQAAPLDVGTEHRLVLCVQYGAPYDDTGVCIVETPALAGTPYDSRPPETDFPPEWGERMVDWVLETGEEKFGPVPEAVEAAIQAEARSQVWRNWLTRLPESSSWEDLLASSEPGVH